MYIAVKTNENLDNLIQELLNQNLSINVRRHPHVTFIDVNVKEFKCGAYINFDEKCLRIFSLITDDEVLVNFEDLVTIYNLD